MLKFNGTTPKTVTFNGTDICRVFMNGTLVFQQGDILYLPAPGSNAVINLRTWINAQTTSSCGTITVVNNHTQPKIISGNLGGLTVEFINNGEIQGVTSGGNALEVTSAMKLTNNGWIRGAGATGGAGGTGGKGKDTTTSAVVVLSDKYDANNSWDNYCCSHGGDFVNLLAGGTYDANPITCTGPYNPGWEGPIRGYYRGSLQSCSGTYAGGGQSCLFSVQTRGTSTTPITGGAGGAGGNGGLGQYYGHAAANGAGGTNGAASSPAGGNSGGKGGGGGRGGTWGNAGATGATGATGAGGGSVGSAGSAGSAGGKSIVGTGNLTGGSTLGNRNGGTTA